VTLGQKQRAFSRCVGLLLLQAYRLGYEISLGDAYRDPRAPYGHPESLHKSRLAIDLNLFKAGKYLRSTEAHRELGEYWERLGQREGLPLRWGGRFNDGNHYSCEHQGRK
jgi:hypothetical protein